MLLFCPGAADSNGGRHAVNVRQAPAKSGRFANEATFVLAVMFGDEMSR